MAMGGCITTSQKESFEITFHSVAVNGETDDVNIRNLPRHLWLDVFSELDVVSQQRVRRVCAAWNHLISLSPLSLRHSVRFELNPRAFRIPWQWRSVCTDSAIDGHPRRWDHEFFHPAASAIDRIFTACGRPETKEIIFSHASGSNDRIPCARRLLFLRSLYDPPNDIRAWRRSRPVAKQRLVFANLALIDPEYDNPPTCDISVPEVILRNVTLLAHLSITPNQTCVMKVTGVNKRCDTAEEVDRLVYDTFVRTDGGIKWAKFVSELAGPLNSREEQQAVDWLSQPDVHRILKDALLKTDVFKSLQRSFQRDLKFGSRDCKDNDRDWFRGLDIWTQRFLYHYLNDNVMCSTEYDMLCYKSFIIQ